MLQEKINKAQEIKKQYGCFKVYVGPTYFLRIYNTGQLKFIQELINSTYSIFAELLNSVLDSKESDIQTLYKMYDNAIDSLD